jgi:hypothetical protein
MFGPKKETVHVGQLHDIIVKQQKLPNSASSQHFGRHRPYAAQTNNEDGYLSDAFILLHNAHALERH